MSHVARALVLFVSALTVGACTLASPTYVTAKQGPADDTDGGNDLTTKSTTADTAAGAGCGTDDFDKPNVASLKACGNGKGHCFAKDKVPMGSQLEACPGSTTDVCVPDEIINAGGGKLASCKSIIGDGACINLELIPEMKARGSGILKADSCTGGLICAPCTNPEAGNAPTGLCEGVGVHKNACTGGAGGAAAPAAAEVACCKSPTSGKSNGVCLPSSSVPADMKDDTIQDTCTADNACVPASMVHGTAVKCDSGLFGKGVCIDNCFSGLMAAVGSIGILGRDVCDDTSTCVPCAFAPSITPGCQ